MNRTYASVGSILALLLVSASPKLHAQAAAQTQTDSDQDQAIELSPFTVTASDQNSGYAVKDTLAGTRVRTELRDVASSLSVVNAQFLKDIGAHNNQDLLVYTPNTEVAGLGGNFSGFRNTFIAGFAQSNFSNPNTETRVRGVDSADNTRDYYSSDIPWDSYIVDRVDLQRGPNSILFGVGSPAGIVNTSINSATYKTGGKIENRISSYEGLRDSLDYNQVLVKNQLAVRIALLDDDTKYREKPAFNRDRRFFAALRADPAFLNNDWMKTTLHANVERGQVDANRPRYTPPDDYITPFFATTDANGDAINKRSFDSLLIWSAGYAGVTGAHNPGPNGAANGPTNLNNNYWIGQYKGPGMQVTNNAVALYPTAGSSNVYSYSQALPYGQYLPSNVGWGVPYFATMGINGMADYARYAGIPGANSSVWKNYSLKDPSIFNYFDNLIDGPNKKEWQNWTAFNAALEQTFLDNRLAYQLAYDRQDYHQGQERNLNSPYISVDINKYVGTSPIWDPTAQLNPYAGYAFVGSGTRDTGGSSNDTLRETFRFTLNGELRASDFLDKNSLLTEILGRHVFTGLYDSNTASTRNLSWTRYALGNDYANAIGLGNKNLLTDGPRVLDWLTYLGKVDYANSPAGLNLPGISGIQSPSGTVSIRYWNPTYNSTLDPNAKTWTNPYNSYTKPGPNQSVLNGTWVSSTGAANYSNPANYVGWTTGNFKVLNADQGDRNSLYTTASKLRTKIESSAVTYQGYLWDDTIVPTWGVRRDRIQNDSGYGTIDPTAGSVLDYNTMQYNPAYRDNSTADSVSWGVVVHMPKALRGKLPLGTDISLHYDHGSNVRSEIRYNFDGNRLPNASGKTDEYGIAINTLNDKVSFKMTWYDTKVQNANLADTSGQNGTLGGNTYELYLLPVWGTAHALTARAGLAGELSSYDSSGNYVQGSNQAPWLWDWAGISSTNSTITGNIWWPGNDPKSAAYKADPVTQMEQAAVNDWFKYMNMGQAWYDAYGFPISTSAWSAGQYNNIVPGYNVASPNVGGIQAAGGGRIRGTFPVGTANTESKGVELEMTAQPINGLNLTFNASRTNSVQTGLGSGLEAAINDQYNRLIKTHAGDMRLWWAGDTYTIGQRFLADIWAPYQFQLQTNGRMVSEMSRWRFNTVANYNFDNRLFNGALKGVNVGAGFRWQKAPVIGYLLTNSTDANWIAQHLSPTSNLNVDLPVYGHSEEHFDFWIGYSRKLTQKINWNIQFNVHNVGERARLEPISVQPLLKADGTPDYANYRIEEGMTWSLTNTFSF